MEVQVHSQVDRQAESEFYEHRRADQNIDQHRCLEQRKQSPLVVIIRHVSRSPDFQESLEKTHELIPECRRKINGGVPAPPAVRAISHNKSPELRHDPRDDQRNRSREDKTRRATERALRHRGERAQEIAIARLLEWLQSANVAGQKSKNRHAQSALPRYPEDGPLQNSGSDVHIIAGRKEVVVPGSGEMSEHD